MTFVYIPVLALVAIITFAGAYGHTGLAILSAIVFFPTVILLYFSPAITAWFRSHPRTGAIAILNLFLGWTLVGWVAALVWAYSPPIDYELVSGEPCDDDFKNCPYCAEQIKVEAVKCRHCQSDL